MIGRLLNLLTTFSVMLLLGVLAAWVVARRVRVVLAVGWDRREYVMALSREVFVVGSEVSEKKDPDRPLSAVCVTRPPDDPYASFGEGFGRLGVTNYGGLGVSGAGPGCSAAGSRTGLRPSSWPRRQPCGWRWIMRARRRVSVGRCPACGYDLRATPDRCPECG